jgi:lipoprotein-anchoring transpeptidase ErfK/SrfK
MNRTVTPAALIVAALAMLAPQAASAATAHSGPVNILTNFRAEQPPLVQKASYSREAAREGERSDIRNIVARVDISDQRMYVSVNGEQRFVFTVSTAGHGYVTPTGAWKPTRMYTMWHSRKYHNAPMAHSIFFHEGYALHATDQIKRLGTPASHGCVRLHPDDARTLFSMVREAGRDNTEIVITQ